MRDAVEKELCDLVEKTCAMARRVGADAVEALARDGTELTVKTRLGEPELVKEAASHAIGLRVFVDGRAANTFTSDLDPAALEGFVRDSVALARLAEPDPLNELPDVADLATGEIPDLELWDEKTIGVDAATAMGWCRQGEAAARAADARITNSEGATFNRAAGAIAFGNSAGFVQSYRGTYATFYVEPICDDEDGKKRNGFWWTASRFLDKLEDREEVGRKAAARTAAKLGSHKVETCEVPVVFDPDAARGLLGGFFGVTNGSAFYRKSSYLIGREGTEVASPLVTIVDDPMIKRAPGSRAFDADGLASRLNVVVEKGVLKTVLCDTYSARKLGRKSTGSSGRAVGGTPGPTSSNYMLLAGETTPAAIVAGVERGLYVTDMMGFGFNPVTGDFSRGAAGFWIEKGERTFPVSEVTISCNFDDLWKRVDAVGNDLDLRSSTASPTLRVSRMTVAGR
jgi:PmbA protein